VDPATFGHHAEVGFMRPEMKPINKHSKMVGPAYTVRLLGRDSCALYYALEHAPKGSVIVVDRCGDRTYACVGEMVALFAECQGFAGIVIDGPATDSIAIEKSGFPVFCTGISVVTTNVIGISGSQDVPISCSGAMVRPGDIVFGDADGVVVIPPDNYEGLLAKAEEAVVREVSLRQHFREGGFPKINIERLHGTDVMGMINELKKFD
jgi:regulator of RNase E activity RraA